MTANADPSDALQLQGIAHARAGRLEDALALLEQAATAWPDNARAHRNLAIVLTMAQRPAQAMASLHRSLALAPDNVDALLMLAQLLTQDQRPLDALRTLDHGLALRPSSPGLLQARGELLAQLSRMGMRRQADALQSMRASLAHGGDPAALRFALASMGDGPTPPVTPPQVVSALFNQYAATFDTHLTQTLKYRGPANALQALQAVAQPATADVLDLGCGTGLCGPVLRPLARTLVGVDLSERMLALAAQRGCYDALVCADIVLHLLPLHSCIDLMVAADVLIYIGDLAPLFAAARRALRAGGRLVFSTESAPAGSVDYVLQATRRYAHTAAYVQRMAADHGLALEWQQDTVLREEAGADVAGTVVVLRAGPAPAPAPAI